MPDVRSSSYQGRVRVRANGLLVDEQQQALLMVNMRSPVTNSMVWLPPGGGIELGETLEKCLVREFHEETGLEISVESLRHVNELVEPPFHAIEFYFDVKRVGGELKLGHDPEHSTGDQILEDLQFIPFTQFNRLPIAPEFLQNKFLEECRNGKDGITYSPSIR